MDRPMLGQRIALPEPLLMRGFAVEHLGLEDVAMAWRLLLDAYAGFAAHEVLALGDDVTSPDWELLGFDVGEVTPRAWSAIAHRTELFSATELARWEPRLNRHGLFTDRRDAEGFLALYRTCDDPDGGWTEAGWEDAPSFYDVVPVHRLRLG